MRRLRWVVAAAAVVIIGTVGLLVWRAPGGERSGPLLLLGDDPRIHVFETDTFLRLGGQLGAGLPVSYDPATHCLYVIYPDETPQLAVWPPGSRPVEQDGRRGVRVPGVGVILEGDRITDAGVGGDFVVDTDPAWGDVGLALRDLDTCLTIGDQFTLFYSITAMERSDT